MGKRPDLLSENLSKRKAYNAEKMMRTESAYYHQGAAAMVDAEYMPASVQKAQRKLFLDSRAGPYMRLPCADNSGYLCDRETILQR